MNYHLARQMVKDGISNIDVDVYEQNHFIPLPNSIQDSRYVIPLTMKELLYLDTSGISELTKKPRPEDSLAMPRFMPEAAEWFAETCAEFEKKQHRQDEFRKLLLQKGWEIVPCIRRLMWADLDKQTALEACRTVAQFYSLIYAGDNEIYHHILRLANRNSFKGYERIRAIIGFAIENPQFVGCGHPLLKQFCPAGRCFIRELINEQKNPYLFAQTGERM